MVHDYKKQGKKNRAAGKRFEIKVREDLEEKGWIVFRNSNDVEDTKFPDAKLKKEGDFIINDFTGKSIKIFKQAKSKWNPFTRSLMMMQSGFPDFVCIKRVIRIDGYDQLFEVKFIECKVNGILSKIEKEKCEWIEQNLKIPVFVAKKGDKRGEILYSEMKGGQNEN